MQSIQKCNGCLVRKVASLPNIQARWDDCHRGHFSSRACPGWMAKCTPLRSHPSQKSYASRYLRIPRASAIPSNQGVQGRRALRVPETRGQLSSMQGEDNERLSMPQWLCKLVTPRWWDRQHGGTERAPRRKIP